MFFVGKKQVANGEPKLNMMKDGSCSWEQPDSKGVGGAEGFCGQTAIANMICIYDRTRGVTPRMVSKAAGDITPGSKPATLMRAIGKLARTPNRFVLKHEPTLPNATPKTPLVCLMHWGGTNYHYVMVVRVTPQAVTINHWGLQQTYPRNVFEQYWGFCGAGVCGGAVARIGALRPYTSIRYQ